MVSHTKGVDDSPGSRRLVISDMQEIVWKGIYYQSIEHCNIQFADDVIEVKSDINGRLNEIVYHINYLILLNRNWTTLRFDISGHVSNDKISIEANKEPDDHWNVNGQYIDQSRTCIDIDLSLTPFTNTLPINRLGLSVGDQQIIDVLYIDLLEKSWKTVKQKYIRLSADEYKFENVPNDFESQIRVDENGLVENYPGLFERRNAPLRKK